MGSSVPPFMPGLALSELLHREAVRPIMAARFPALAYSAARLDFGSDVLGFDTPRSTDHDWGPRLTLFVDEADYHLRHAISAALAEDLPDEVGGYPTRFVRDPETGTRWLPRPDEGPANPWVPVATVQRFFEWYVGLDPTSPITVAAWLTTPQQRLRTVASGKVFHDGLGTLESARQALRWYPHDVWLYLLACQWRRIDQEEPFMARCGDVGDELGSRLVASRLIMDVMRLCLLMSREYAPYVKWLGTAFARLECSERLLPLFHEALSVATWREREGRLSSAYLILAEMHNSLGLTTPIEPEVGSFHDRPYLVPHSGRFEEALYGRIDSPDVLALPRHVGAINQFVDSTDVLESPSRCRMLDAVYGADSGNDSGAE